MDKGNAFARPNRIKGRTLGVAFHGMDLLVFHRLFNQDLRDKLLVVCQIPCPQEI